MVIPISIFIAQTSGSKILGLQPTATLNASTSLSGFWVVWWAKRQCGFIGLLQRIGGPWIACWELLTWRIEHLSWQVGSPASSLLLVSPKGHWTWRWARLTPILWLSLLPRIERNVSSFPSARVAILQALLVVLWQGHSFGMRCILSWGLCLPQWFLVPPSNSFLHKLLVE